MKKLAILTALALALGACGGPMQKVMLGPNASTDARDCGPLVSYSERMNSVIVRGL